MYLIAAATSFELAPFSQAVSGAVPFATLVTGIGPVEAAMRCALFLARHEGKISGVMNIGVAGAYCREQGRAALLDICLASREVLGDLGICCEGHIQSLSGGSMEIVDTFDLDQPLLQQAVAIALSLPVACHTGTFVTVNCVSGTRQRGDSLAQRHDALCENMEGAAIARVCQHFGLPLLELRCVSNLVEQRDRQQWRLHEACQRSGEVAAAVFERLPHG